MGSIQKRGDNTYFLTVSGGFGLNGKRKRFTRTVQAKDEKHAKKLLAQFESEVQSNNFIKADKISFESYCNYWLKNYAKNNVAARTYQRYEEILTLRVIPAFKKFRLDQVKPSHLLQFYSNLLEDGIRKDKKQGGLSERTIQHHHRLINTMLEHAVGWQMLKDNPAKSVKPPKVSATDIEFYTEEQIMTLIEKLNNAPVKYMTMITLAIFTGISRGEIMGLTWSNVNEKDSTIFIGQAAQYIRKEGVSFKEPKNKYRKRKITVPEFVMTLLMTWRTIQLEDRLAIEEIYQNNDLVFAQDTGSPMHPDTITSWFRDFIKENNLPPITFHGLRHTHATILLSNNTDILTVSRRLGHNKASTTVDIYGHPIQSAEKIAAENMGKILKKSVDNLKVSSNCHQDEKKASS